MDGDALGRYQDRYLNGTAMIFNAYQVIISFAYRWKIQL